jgi:hypothetical protein
MSRGGLVSGAILAGLWVLTIGLWAALALTG